MNQGGLKNVVTEPTRLENKRERRRGAAGRAAVLRRAPSDSDCSGETASLSADSGDRAVRLPPQPSRAAKTRGRRRGSEWEVLEGLKDGQRFEKRPDVFNGYLHKKRKWPLKGWHKRFFVVDGGILVYARSPTDVARGRLHGSVDVGLSVISAKARRRRIDIDADEFIYHLRAKTPDVFRTWLNVLKAHRLYRQHLLTFGARESVPKIHAPLDDLPATDNSSRSSHDSHESSTLSTSDDFPFTNAKDLSPNETCNNKFCFCHSNCYPPIEEHRETVQVQIPGKLPKNYGGSKKLLKNHRSLCSMNCVARFTQEDLNRSNSPKFSPGTTIAEKQILSTDLDINSIRTIETVIEDQVLVNRESSPVRYPADGKVPIFLDKIEPTAAYFFRSVTHTSDEQKRSHMRRSKKSTNLVKYRNRMDEPTLTKPLSNCMLLGDATNMKVSKKFATKKAADRSVACEPVPQESNEVHVKIIDQKSVQDVMTISDYDNITEKVLISIFQKNKNVLPCEAEYYIKQVVRDLYDVKFQNVNPVKALFRSLLEYWLQNTKIDPVKAAMRQTQSIGKQSNKYFTKDKNMSNVYISNVTKQTQFNGMSDNGDSERYAMLKTSTKVLKDQPSMCKMSESFEKDRRIQDLEKLLQNTVYMCETELRNDPSKQKDIKTTKTLIENIGKPSQRANVNKVPNLTNENSNSSTEKIKDTINHLISETSISPDVAKEFFGAYLDVLLKDEDKSTSSSYLSSEHSIVSKGSKELSCDVQTEAVVKRVSKSVTTFKPTEPEKVNTTEAAKPVDPGQMYLKDILDKITPIFSKVKQLDEKNDINKNSTENNKTGVFKEKEQKDELGRPVKEYPGKNLVYENFDENSVVIDLTKFDLEHISMFSDPAIKGIMSITIKLKEKPTAIAETKKTHLSLQFAESQRLKRESKKEYAVDDNWIKYIHHSDTKSNEIFQKKVKIPKHTGNPFIDNPKEFDLKPYSSSSDATSKNYIVTHESEHSLDFSFNSSNYLRNDSIIEQSFENQGTQSCYMMSFKKELLASKFHSRKKTNLKECGGILLTPRVITPRRSPTKHTELSVFEKSAPRVIDEKFILLLLENLSLLSKNIPSLHKEINSLFLKLRKKHEKVLKSCVNIQGLSLLGKIYNEESCGPGKKDAKTQWDVILCNSANKEVSINENAVNTCSSDKIRERIKSIDAHTSAIDRTLLMNSEVQTVSEELLRPRRRLPSLTDTSLMTNMAETGSVNSMGSPETGVKTADNSTSIPNWFQNIDTKERSMCTIIKYMLDTKKEMGCLHPPPPPPSQREHGDKKKHPRLPDFKEISLLSPAFKVSTQSQTEKRLIRFMRENTDFNVYQLFTSKKFNMTRASSLTDSNIESSASDELKTLYRCNSDSYCSG